MKKVLIIGAMVLGVGLAALAGSFGTDRLLAVLDGQSDGQADGRSEGEGRQATRVTVAAPEIRTLRDTFRAVGTVRPVRSVELRPLSEGRVEEVAASSGETVAEGALIFALDDRAARAALADAEATLNVAEAQFRRYEALQDENVAAEARLEEERGAFLRAQAAVDAARATLEDRRVTAPFGGVLGVLDLDPGERVDPATSVTTLDDLSTVEVEFAMPERYFGAVEAGQTITLRVAAYPERTFEGEVAVIAPRIGDESRSFAVRADVANDDRALVGGMFVNATLVFGTREALTVPDDAIVSEGSATYVYVAADGTAARTEVAPGTRQDGRTEVTEGLAEGDRVVTTGYDTLSDGDPVRVAEDAASGEALN